MAYQFIHVESYSISSPKKGKNSGHSVSSIVSEAIRNRNSIPHVENPLPPKYLYGKPLEQLGEACSEWVSSMTDSKGRKLRKDALCLVAGVVSMPEEISSEAWDKFKFDAVEYLKLKYGNRLETVIEHTDEKYPHLHFYVVPRAGERFESIHQGKAAAAEKKHEVKGLQNQAYKAAMRAYQNEFYESVGIPHGLARIGPRRRRLTREEWKLEQIQAESAAKTISVAKASVELSRVESQTIKQQAVEDAKIFADKTIKKADQILKIAEARGFQSGFSTGIEEVDKLGWWKKVGIYLSGAVRERVQLKAELELVRKDKEGWAQKAFRYLSINKKLNSELVDIKPKLESAEEELLITRFKAKQAARLREDNDQLARDLSDAQYTIESLKVHMKALKSRVYEQSEPELERNLKARRYEDEKLSM